MECRSMIPADTPMQLEKSLTNIASDSFSVDNNLKSNKDSIRTPRERITLPYLVCILFGRPEVELMQAYIRPHITYFHHRSGHNFHIIFAGYKVSPSGYITPKDDEKKDFQWSFHNNKFNQMRKWFECQTKWKYSGLVDMIFANAEYYPKTHKASLDFSSSIVCDLDMLIGKKVITDISKFIENICQIADDGFINNPTREFSNKMRTLQSCSILKRIVLSLIPENYGFDLENISKFAVRNIGKVIK